MKKGILFITLICFVYAVHGQDSQLYQDWFNKGAKAYYNQDYREAINCYDQAIKFNRKSEVAYHNRGLAKYMLKDNKAAIKDYTKCIELKSNYAEAYISRGVAKMEDTDESLQDAIKDFAAALAIDETSHLAFYNRGVAKYRLKKYDEAITDFDNCLKNKSNYNNAILFKGLCHYEKREFREGEKVFCELVSADPKNKLAYYNRALCYIKLDENDKACEDLKKATELGYDKAQTYYEGICTKK